MTKKEKREKTREEKRKENISFVLWLIGAVVFALCLRFFVFEFAVVDGSSMEPTLYEEHTVLVDKLSYVFGEPERGQVVVCDLPNFSNAVIKRVIGLPGDTVEVRGGVVYLNGAQLKDDVFTGYIEYETPPTYVPDDYVFVLGDNRNASTDSHSIGPVPQDSIVGKAAVVVLPLDRIGTLARPMES